MLNFKINLAARYPYEKVEKVEKVEKATNQKYQYIALKMYDTS